jgi:hypothetical protein
MKLKTDMTSRLGIGVTACLTFVCFSAGAHHSVALQYDMTKEVTIVGSVVDMEWRNPHAWLHIEVENEDGVAELWKVEFGSANSLYKRGWRPASLPVGTVVTVHGLPARDGSRSVEGDEVILADGTEMFAGDNPEDR